MPPKRDNPISAQVVLAASSGKRPDATSSITSETIHEFLPSAETAERVRAQFADLGFTVGKLVGNSFPISGPASLFESVFHVALRESKATGVQFVDRDGSAHHQLDHERVPPALREHVAAITFTAPPEFGPTNFSH